MYAGTIYHQHLFPYIYASNHYLFNLQNIEPVFNSFIISPLVLEGKSYTKCFTTQGLLKCTVKTMKVKE